MADNFFKIKNGLTIPVYPNDPTVTPPAGSTPGDAVFYNGELYIRTAAQWEKVIAGAAQSTEIADNSIINSKLADNAVTEIKLANSAVTESKLASNAVTDVKVALSAAIAGTKISPDFGSQNVATTGTLTGTAFLGSNIGAVNNTDMKTLFGYGRIVSPAQTASAAGNETIDCSLKHVALKTGGTATITLGNLAEGQTFTLVVNSTGSAYTITWSPTIKWQGSVIPTPTPTSGVKDVYTFIKIGGDILGTVAKNMG